MTEAEYSILKTALTGIKNEINDGAITPNRLGTQLLNMLEKLHKESIKNVKVTTDKSFIYVNFYKDEAPSQTDKPFSTITLERGEYAEGGLTPEEKELFDALVAEVFKLKVTYKTNNAGTYEIGTAITPSVTLDITRQGKDVSGSAVITAPNTTINDSNNGWTANEINSGDFTFRTSVSQGGQTVTLADLTWSFANYRYYGVTDEITEQGLIANNAKAIKDLRQTVSASTTLDETPYKSGKGFVFAVAESCIPEGKKLMLYDAGAKSYLTAETSEFEVNLPRVNKQSVTDSYIVVYLNTKSGADSTIKVELVDKN